MTLMTWLSIIAWLVLNLPGLISAIMDLFNRSKVMTVAQSNNLRLEFTEIIQSKSLTRKEKRLKARAILHREGHLAALEEMAVRGI